MDHVKAKSNFIFEDTVVPTRNVVLVVHSPDPLTLDVWMPRVVTDSLTYEIRESLIEAITDFLKHVPVRKS